MFTREVKVVTDGKLYKGGPPIHKRGMYETFSDNQRSSRPTEGSVDSAFHSGRSDSETSVVDDATGVAIAR